MKITTISTMPSTMSPAKSPANMSPVAIPSVVTSPISWLAASAHNADLAAASAMDVRVRAFAGTAKQDRPPRGAPH